jgi:hypothetical protein
MHHGTCIHLHSCSPRAGCLRNGCNLTHAAFMGHVFRMLLCRGAPTPTWYVTRSVNDRFQKLSLKWELSKESACGKQRQLQVLL